MFNKKKEKIISDYEALKKLPHNRKELFFDLLKNRKMFLFSFSCFTFLFFIPLFIDLLYFSYMELAAFSLGDIDVIFTLLFYSLIISIPCNVIVFIGLSGAFYVSKKLVWQEGINLSHDFLVGIKENYKKFILFSFIFSLSLFILVIGGIYLLTTSSYSPLVNGIGIGILIVQFIICGIIINFSMTQAVYYDNKLRDILKNSFVFLSSTHIKSFLLFLLTNCVIVFLCLLNNISLIISFALIAILNSAIIILWTLLSHAEFDKLINKENYPEYVNKGLYKKED